MKDRTRGPPPPPLPHKGEGRRVLTLFLSYATHPPLPPYGVLLATVSSDGVEGRPAGAVQRKPCSRGRAERPGGIRTSAPKGSHWVPKGHKQVLSVLRRSPAGSRALLSAPSPASQAGTRRAGQRPRLPCFPRGTNATLTAGCRMRNCLFRSAKRLVPSPPQYQFAFLAGTFTVLPYSPIKSRP